MMYSFATYLRLVLPIICLISGSLSAHAQTAAVIPSQPQAPSVAAASQSFSSLLLRDNINSAYLENHLYVIPDPTKALSTKLITDKFPSGLFSKYLVPSPNIHLGLNGITTWLVIPINNSSSTDLWELNLGDITSGRHAFLNRINVYNGLTHKTIYDSAPSDGTRVSIAPTIKLNLPIGQRGLIIIEARSIPGSISPLELSLKKTYARETALSSFKAPLLSIPLLAGAILFSAFMLKRRSTFLAFSLVWFLIYLHAELVNHFIYAGGTGASVLVTCIWLLVGLLLIAGLWLYEDKEIALPSSLFKGLGFLVLICGLISLLISNFVPLIGSALTYAPPLIAGMVLLLIGTLQGLHSSDRTYFMLAFSGLTLIASISILLGSAWLGLSNPILYSASFVALCLSAASCAAFSLVIRRYEPVAVARSDNQLPSAKSKELNEAKENSEHTRLMKVLDQERATMAEMQVQEARRTEEMRKAKEAADMANNAKSAFLAVVSHEIRTPMTGIMGMVRLLLDTTLSKDQKEYTSTIQDSGEALMSLLNDILDFEKIESGKFDLESTSFDLHRLIRGVQTLMNGHANSKGIELKLELDPKLPNYFMGDPTRLRQIFLNLVNNAIKFTSAKGTVYIRINDLTPDDQLDGSHQIYFAVQDSGIGISPEVQKKLFMPFAQADSSTARKYGGTGLGLAICKRLIEVMGGVINISSKPGEGATFFFTLSLPLGQSDGVLSSFAGAASGSGPVESISLSTAIRKSLQILVVDDNGINQKVLTGLLEKDGHAVVTASTGAEALGKYLASTYDLVLMDIELPDKSGVAVTQDIRGLQDSIKATVPVVAMTGNTSEQDVAAYFKAGMDDFLAKPINHERLRKILSIASGNGQFANTIAKPASQPFAGNDVYVPVPPPPRGSEPEYVPIPLNIPKDLPEAPSLIFDHGDADEDEDTFASAIRQFEATEKESRALESDLDEKMLATLQNTLSVTQLEELLTGFYEKTEELITVIGQNYLSKDYESLRARAHELKGMAGNFGFKGVGNLSGQIEIAAKSQNEADLKKPVEHLAETYAVSKARLIKTLSGSAE